MDCEERLLEQAKMTKAQNPKSNVFVYRNLVKALPWFASVREKLDDPAYSGWFLRFDASTSTYHVPACAAENSSKCSLYYHDQGQTPEVPTLAHPNPDGKCADGVCDCGTQPCGEYLFDHRNGTMLRDWLIKEHIGGSMGLGSPSVDGVFMDDFWCSNRLCAADPSIKSCPCSDPVQGPTEIDRKSQFDMGLSDVDIEDITIAWNQTMTAVENSILERNDYTWWLMAGQANANAMPTLLRRETCASQLREACQPGAIWQLEPRLVGLSVNGTQLTQLEQDVAFFLLVRGPYAWLGWGVWGMTWPFNPEPAHGTLPPLRGGVPRPALLNRDFGEPRDNCTEMAPGVFHRTWTRASVVLNCATFQATLDGPATNV